MGKFDGTYVLESHTNLKDKLKALGIPDDSVRKFLDPKNVVTFIMTETSPGCLEMKTTTSNIPEWNNTCCLKLGERTELKIPFEYTKTLTKKNDNTLNLKTEMKGVVIDADYVYHSYGVSGTGTIGGITFTEEFKKVALNVSGYYVYESGTGLDDVLKWFDLPFSDGNELMRNGGFRVVEKENGMWIEELFGGVKKEYFAKFDEEIDYERPDWNFSDKRITTKTAPGVYKTVCKDKKKGKVWDWTTTVTATGLTIETNAGGFKALETYKRGVDMSGMWKTVAYTGGEGYASALGITGDQKEKYIGQVLNFKFDVERLPNGLINVKSNSPCIPGGVLNFKSGETFTLEDPEFGTIENIGYEGPDSWTQVTKFLGRTITIKEKYSGNFIIGEAIVDNIKSSTSITIYTRD